MIPVLVISPEGKDVEVADPGLTAAEMAEPAYDYSRWVDFCELTAAAQDLSALADELHAIAAKFDPHTEVREENAAHHKAMASGSRTVADSYRRMAKSGNH